jgi:hypothetical protein
MPAAVAHRRFEIQLIEANELPRTEEFPLKSRRECDFYAPATGVAVSHRANLSLLSNNKPNGSCILTVDEPHRDGAHPTPAREPAPWPLPWHQAELGSLRIVIEALHPRLEKRQHRLELSLIAAPVPDSFGIEPAHQLRRAWSQH